MKALVNKVKLAEKFPGAAALLIFIGCCLQYGTISGIGSNCKGIFYTPMAQDLGVPLSSVTLYLTFYGITAALCIPLCEKLYRALPARVSLILLTGFYSATVFLMGNVESTAALYVLGALQGVPGGFLITYPIQQIVAAWYPQRKGTVMGFVAMSSGVAGMLINPLAQSWIQWLGWRAAEHALGILMLITGVAAGLLLKKTPEEGGDASANAGEEQPLHSRAPDAGRSTILAFIAFALIVDLVIAFPQILPSFALSVGETAAFGALLVSSAMFGNIAFKLLLGLLNDHLGVEKTTMLAALPLGSAALIMAFASERPLLLGAAFLGGVVLGIYALQFPLLFRRLCSRSQFERYFSRICAMNSLVGSFSASVLSFGYNCFGSFRPVMLLCAAGMGVCALLGLWFDRRMKAGK